MKQPQHIGLCTVIFQSTYPDTAPHSFSNIENQPVRCEGRGPLLSVFRFAERQTKQHSAKDES